MQTGINKVDWLEPMTGFDEKMVKKALDEYAEAEKAYRKRWPYQKLTKV